MTLSLSPEVAPTLEDVVTTIMRKHTKDSGRLDALADFVIRELEAHRLPKARGGSGGELCIAGFGRDKVWDVAYNFAGKDRLLISLKSLWSNASGTVPNRIDDLMGEAASVQQMAPEIVTGYILLFDKRADGMRKADKLLWSAYFEQQVRKLAIRKAPLWNQGLLEGCWFILIDGDAPAGSRVVDPAKAKADGEAFFTGLLRELKVREPAIPFSKAV